jgi:hypothetical protein
MFVALLLHPTSRPASGILRYAVRMMGIPETGLRHSLIAYLNELSHACRNDGDTGNGIETSSGNAGLLLARTTSSFGEPRRENPPNRESSCGEREVPSSLIFPLRCHTPDFAHPACLLIGPLALMLSVALRPHLGHGCGGFRDEHGHA